MRPPFRILVVEIQHVLHHRVIEITPNLKPRLMSSHKSVDQGHTKPHRRHRRIYACDSCYRKKIKCDGSSPKCDWCYHHNISCTFTRNNTRHPHSNSHERQDYNKLSSSPISDASTLSSQSKQLTGTLYPSPGGPQAVAPQGFGSDLCFAGQSLGNICAFNGLPFFSPSGIEWIKARTGEDSPLDQYCAARPTAWPRTTRKYRAGHHIPLPDKTLLLEQLSVFRASVFCQLFPIIDPFCFEYTVRTAYNNDLSDISPGVSSAKACIFAFMAFSSFFTIQPHQDTIVDADELAMQAHDLLPDMFNESVTLDGLQALLMLCICSQAISGDILSLELLLSSAARYVFHLKGHIHLNAIDGDVPNAKLHVRNLFWVCFIIDKTVSLHTGLQPVFDVSSCDLTLPLTPREDTSPRHLPPSNPYGNSTIFLTMIRLSLVQSRIYHGLYSVSALRQSDAELLATIRSLDCVLEEWRSSVPLYSKGASRNEGSMVDFLVQMQYHYCMAAIHQTSSRCTSWTKNQDTHAAGSSLAIGVGASRSVLQTFLETQPQLEGHFLRFCLPELTVSTMHIFSNILSNPLQRRSEDDLSLIKSSLAHIKRNLWQQAPATFTTQVHLVEGFIGDLQHLAESAILKAWAESRYRHTY
ncbi:C6 zinc finger domain protein [Aspergillus filifer]